MTKTNRLALVYAAVALICGATYFGLEAATPTSEAEVIRTELKARAAQLDDADRKGDSRAAAAMLDEQIAMLRALNDKPGIEKTAMQNCRLAAVHLGSGVTDVVKGGRWADRDRYEAAIADCK